LPARIRQHIQLRILTKVVHHFTAAELQTIPKVLKAAQTCEYPDTAEKSQYLAFNASQTTKLHDLHRFMRFKTKHQETLEEIPQNSK
jgi:ribosomal protein L14E/L6E/L27E